MDRGLCRRSNASRTGPPGVIYLSLIHIFLCSLLALADSSGGAGASASTAIDAGISVDNVLAIALGNSAYGTFCCACLLYTSGFVFAQSRRQVGATWAASLKRALDPRIQAVGVFVLSLIHI